MAGKVDEGGVEGELDRDVDVVNPRQRDAEDGHGTDGVEEDLESAEKGLAEDGVEEDGLEGGRKVGVEAVDAEGLVMGQMVRAEGGRVGNSDGNVGNNGEEAIGKRRAKGEVVGDLVDSEEKVLVRRRAEDVGYEPKLPAEERGVPEGICQTDLESHDA